MLPRQYFQLEKCDLFQTTPTPATLPARVRLTQLGLSGQWRTLVEGSLVRAARVETFLSIMQRRLFFSELLLLWLNDLTRILKFSD